MPYANIQFRLGINREVTARTNEGGLSANRATEVYTRVIGRSR